MTAAAGLLVSKSQYAVLKNVSPSRVTQWISEGKIDADALVGEGRAAKINVAIADQQLRRKLDPGQRSAAQTAKLAIRTVTIFEGAMPEIAGEFAAKFNLSQRDVLHLLRSQFRRVRVRAAAPATDQNGVN